MRFFLFLLVSSGHIFMCQLRAQSFSMPVGVDEIEIPVELISSLMIARAEVNGVQMKFILDTGAARSTIFNLNDVDSLVVGEGDVTEIKGYGSLEPFKAIKSEHNYININGFESKDATINVLTEEQISFVSILGTEVNGIIGIDFFKNHVFEINYRKSKILVRNKKQSWNLVKFKKLNLKLINSKPYLDGFVRNKSDKQNMTFLLDTGSGDALWMFEKSKSFNLPKKGFRDYLGFGLSGDVFGFRSKLTECKISDFSFQSITFALPELDRSPSSEGNSARGSIGGEVLRRFDVILDYPAGHIYLKKNKAFRQGFYYNMAGIRLEEGEKELITRVKLNYNERSVKEIRAITNLMARDQKTTFYSYNPKILVSYVIPDSPADKLGVKEGDQVIGFFKKELGEFSMGEVSSRFYKDPGTVIPMRFKRGEEFYEVKIRLDPVVD